MQVPKKNYAFYKYLYNYPKMREEKVRWVSQVPLIKLNKEMSTCVHPASWSEKFKYVYSREKCQMKVEVNW